MIIALFFKTSRQLGYSSGNQRVR